jgi:hypothetical protein
VLGPVGPDGVASGPDDELPPHAAVKNSDPAVTRTKRDLDTMSARIASGGPSLQAAFNVRARQTIDGVLSHGWIAEAHIFVASAYASAYHARGEYQVRSARTPPVTFRF